MSRLRDANQHAASTAVVQSTRFHPNGQMLMTAGFDKKLRLFAVDGLRNPLLQVRPPPPRRRAFLHTLPLPGCRRSFTLASPSASRLPDLQTVHVADLPIHAAEWAGGGAYAGAVRCSAAQGGGVGWGAVRRPVLSALPPPRPPSNPLPFSPPCRSRLRPPPLLLCIRRRSRARGALPAARRPGHHRPAQPGGICRLQ
jgi:hypothetical protein